VAFRKQLAGVVCKPPYAACVGNNFVVNDKEKRWLRTVQVIDRELKNLNL